MFVTEYPCPTCRQLFPSLWAMYEHWKVSGCVEVKRSEVEIKQALASIGHPRE